MSDKKHYRLFAGILKFQDGEDIFNLNLNAIHLSDSESVTYEVLNEAQRALQARLYQIVQNPQIKVLDIFVSNITYMGYMSAEEFNPTAEPTA